MKNAGKACNNRLYRHIRTFEKIVKNYFVISQTSVKKNRDHALSGNWNGYRECHILPDWLLIYKLEDNILILTLVRTGTHSNLFNK